MGLIKDKIKKQQKEEYAYKKMLDFGWTPDQAAGIVGNLIRESNLDTSVLGTADTKGSRGIAQWHSERLKTLQNKYGSNWTDLDNQLDFVNWELNNTHKKAGDKLRTAKGVYNTGRIVSDDYERPKVKFNADTKRQTLVLNTYKKLSGIPFTQEDLQGTAQKVMNEYNTSLILNSNISPIDTPEISNLVSPIEISNLAESNETEAVQKAKEELDYKQQQQINQQRFIQDLLTASQVQYIDPNQIAQEDIYNQEQYFQSGGRRMSIPNPRLTQRDNIITPDIDIIDLDDPKNFTIEYLQSPKYRERLINSGYKNVDALINQRVQRVQTIKDVIQTGKPTELQKTYYDFIGKSYNPAGGSGYIGNTNEIITDTQTDRKIPKFYGVGKKGVRAHELGHAENFDTPMNKRDNDQLFHRLKEQQISSDYPIEERNAQEELGYQYQPHNFKPDENKSDLNALRFLLKEQGIYDAGTQNFTKEHLKKLKSNSVKDRLLKNYKEEDLIWLMNNVAQNEEESYTYAQNGGVQQSQEYLQNWYQNRVLPDPILNQTYQNEKQQYLNQAQSLPSPQYVSNIDDQNTQGTYDYKTGNINLLKTASPLVYTHEGTHKINLPLKDTQSNVNAFSIIGENVIPQNKIENQWIKDNYSQISNYQEVIPRLNAYRQKYQLQPDQVITPELIQQNRQQYLNSADYEDNTDQLYKLFENEGLSNVLNKVVSNDNSSQYYGQTGGVIKDNNGYWNPNNWGKVVEINSNNITMRGVSEPLLGIGDNGVRKLMIPGENYIFEGAKKVTEYPIKRNKTKRFS